MHVFRMRIEQVSQDPWQDVDTTTVVHDLHVLPAGLREVVRVLYLLCGLQLQARSPGLHDHHHPQVRQLRSSGCYL